MSLQKHLPPSRRRVFSMLVALGLALPLSVAAQSGKVIRLVLPNATGSGVDTLARTAQPALSKAFGQTVVVENQPGAGGILGLQMLARATPDGATLSIVSNNVVIFPAVQKSLPFDMPGDFTPIAVLGAVPIVLVTNPKVPATNARELTALLKARPGELNFGSGGNGTILHLAAEMFLDEAGATAQHVPYKGVGPMLTDLIGGQVQFATAALASVQPHIKSGALRVIGVASPKRLAAAPEIPTFVEQGVPGYLASSWFAVLGPKGMPADDVRRVRDAFASAIDDPAVRDAMNAQGNVMHVSNTAEAQQYFRSEMAKYAALVKKAGITAQ